MLNKIIALVLFYATINTCNCALAQVISMNAKATLTKRLKTFHKEYVVVDIQNIDIKNSQTAIKTFTLSKKPKVINCDILIVGGSTGGVAASLTAAHSGLKAGLKICLTEETDWLGGQMTSQGVSALDENYLVETSGATKNYQQLRQLIRKHYLDQINNGMGANAEIGIEIGTGIMAETGAEIGTVSRSGTGIRITTGAKNDAGIEVEIETDTKSKACNFNPGNCWVSRLSFEPKVALVKIDQLLSPYVKNGTLDIHLRLKPVATKIIRHRIKSVLMIDLDLGSFIEFRPKICIDATELGDLLPLANIDYVSGAESQIETGEIHAPQKANLENVQDYTYPFVLEFRENEKHIINKPTSYETFKNSGKFSFLFYKMFEANKHVNTNGEEYLYLPFWEYRRLLAKSNFPNTLIKHDLAMINWESNDMRGANIIDQAPDIAAKNLSDAKNLSLSFLYWLQTEAPRDTGGNGYPELALKTDILDTKDGLSKYPYIRESRRIKAKYTIVEEDIAASANQTARAKIFSDSVGIGLYPIDIHGHQDVAGAGQEAKPFQIPFHALVQDKVHNLLPACKNIGTTHVTNGAYRLHPIEWAIGEAAGITASISVIKNTSPIKIANNKRALLQMQHKMINTGSPLFWYDDIPVDHLGFNAAQFFSVTKIIKHSENNLHFEPEKTLSKNEAIEIITSFLRLCTSTKILSLPKKIMVNTKTLNDFVQNEIMGFKTSELSDPLTWQNLDKASQNRIFKHKPINNTKQAIAKIELAQWLYELITDKYHLGI
jgi:hypothetical protein